MNIKSLAISIEAFSRGGKIIATEVSPDYPYVNGVRDTTKLIGHRVKVVFPNNGYEDQIVRVSNTTDNLSALLSETTPDKPLYVEFVDFSGSIYSMRGNDGRWVTGVSAKAADVKPVLDDSFEVLIDD